MWYPVAMKPYFISGGVLILVVAGIAWYFNVPALTFQRTGTNTPPPSLPTSPLFATYRIEDREVTLNGGYASHEVAEGSASRTETRVFGEPVMGDLNGDGTEDAALLLTQTTGGTGTFFYVAAALARGDGFLGTDAAFLGDRIAPQNITLRDGVLTVNYAEHAEGQALADAPTAAVSAYFTLTGAYLSHTDVSGDGIQVLFGTLVYGHEARTFTPCGGEPYWIHPDSRAGAALQAIYDERTRDREPYTPLYVVLVGTIGSGMTDGFGADFPFAITIQQLLSVPAEGSCSTTTPPFLTP